MTVQFTTQRADYSIWSRSKNAIEITFQKNQGRVHQFGTKFLPEKFTGYALNVARSWTSDLFDNGYGRFANNSNIWNSCEMFQMESSGNFHEKHRIRFPHAERAKSCKRNSRCPPLRSKREATPRRTLSKILQKKKKKPKIQIQMSKLDNVSGGFLEIIYVVIMLLRERTSVFHRTMFRHLLVTLMCRDKRKQALLYFMWQPSMIIVPIDADFLKLGSVWQESNCPTKHPPEGHLRCVRQTVTKKTVTARPESTWPEEMLKHVEKLSAQGHK